MEYRYLFKAKRIDNGEWITGYLLVKKKDFYICEKPYECMDEYSSLNGQSYGFGGFKFVDPSTICQCTGLKDKNRKLIWEKDIVDGHIKRGAAFLNCLVLWNESKARFDVRAKGYNFPMTLDEVTGDISVGGLDYEVVGNQFDNPELLELLEV